MGEGCTNFLKISKSKGVKNVAVQTQLQLLNYLNCLITGDKHLTLKCVFFFQKFYLIGGLMAAKFHMLRSKKHSINEICQTKIAISASYDKGFLKNVRNFTNYISFF